MDWRLISHVMERLDIVEFLHMRKFWKRFAYKRERVSENLIIGFQGLQNSSKNTWKYFRYK